MDLEIDILENELLEKYPNVLDILLKDQTTKGNIFWATDNYSELGDKYQFSSPITTDLITGKNGNIIVPRIKKQKELQQLRARDMAEVFTPSWVCNSQNNLVDNAWFGKENVFNFSGNTKNGISRWEVNQEKVSFPKGKNWMSYVKDTRLEMACGEAPYITSRYDTTTGEFIEVGNRIGLLDRKLRIINENVFDTGSWLEAAQVAYKNIYGFEWQGDSLLLAREAMLITFIENFKLKFGKEPFLKSIKCIANIISFNVWQMDALKGVIPNSCIKIQTEVTNLFGETEIKMEECDGCLKNNIKKHNGIYCLINDWGVRDLLTNKVGRALRFIDTF
jgi:hypothetical protein